MRRGRCVVDEENAALNREGMEFNINGPRSATMWQGRDRLVFQATYGVTVLAGLGYAA
jgi:hypothetical protein